MDCDSSALRGSSPKVRFLRRLALLTGLLVALAGSSGCRNGPRPNDTNHKLAQSDLPMVENPAALRSEVIRLLDHASADFIGASADVAASTTDRKVREATILWKVRTATGIQLIINEQDPRHLFLLTWLAFVTARRNWESSERAGRFPEQQKTILDLVTSYEKQAVEIGKRHFGEAKIEAAAPQVEAMSAESYPITDLISDLTAVKAGEPARFQNALTSIAQVSLSPVKGLQGVSDTPMAIRGFTSVASNFSNVVRLLPQLARWEAELLLLEVDSLDSVVDVRKSLETFSKSAEALSKRADTLPRDIRIEIQEALGTLDAPQEKLQKTIQEARQSLDALDKSLASSQTLAVTVRDIVGKVSEAGGQWESTARAVQGVLTTYQALAAESAKEEPKPEEPCGAREFGDMAVRIEDASSEVRALLEDLNSGKLEAALAGVQKSSLATVNQAADRADALADRITVRVCWVLGGVFAFFVAYRFLTVSRKTRRDGPERTEDPAKSF
jgi:hypothetical protein